jgi:Protein of unknown function (DUF2829)
LKTYIGTKKVNATPMTRKAYNDLRGWEVPADENGDDEGFLVEYTDGGKANVAGFDGYVSWSPADVFSRAYKEVEVKTEVTQRMTSMDFSYALRVLKSGGKMTRSGWNGKGMWLKQIKNTDYVITTVPIINKDDDGFTDPLPYIGMRTACSGFVPWTASQTDLLESDWEVVE